MLAESSVKAAFQTKILSVISLDVQCQPQDDDDPRQTAPPSSSPTPCARCRRHASCRLVGAASGDCGRPLVCEKVWDENLVATGRWRGKRVYKIIKAKDTRFLQLGSDPYRNVIAIRGMGYNAGRVWSPHDFILFNYLSLFESPTGMSDFRAAYRPYWFKHTAWQMRGLHLQNFTRARI
jgi:hypothetical protein